MRSLFVTAAASALALVSAPASAASTINLDGTVRLDSAAGGAPFDFTVNYLGYGGSPVHDITALSAVIDFTFTGTSNAGKTYNFSFAISNTSSADSRLTVFGFGVNPLVSGTSSTGQFDVAVTSPNAGVPNFGYIDVCFKDAGQTNNCNNGQGGVNDGALPISGTLALNFGTAPGHILLDSFVVRYQSINGVQGVTSAIGRGTVETPPPVPEPATWALMIAGFGLVGAAVRRRPARQFA